MDWASLMQRDTALTRHPTRNAVIAICAIAAIILLVQLLRIHLGMRQEPASPAPEPTAAATPGSDISPLLQRQLFGEAARPATQSDGNLILRAVFAGASPTTGGAILEAPGQPPRYYRAGEALPGGATLQEVGPNQIVLLRNGQQELLNFPLPASSPAPTPASDATAQAPATPAATPREEGGDYRALAAYLADNPQGDAIRQRLEELRDRARTAREQAQQATPGTTQGSRQ